MLSMLDTLTLLFNVKKKRGKQAEKIMGVPQGYPLGSVYLIDLHICREVLILNQKGKDIPY